MRERPLVDRFTALAAPGAHVLDLGCGTGVPITRHLLDHGFRVTGVDSSSEMLRRASARCPEAHFLLGDMTEPDTLERIGQLAPFGGVVAWDSIFHVPRSQHSRLFAALFAWLSPGAPVLLSAGGSAGEFTAPMYGVEFFYSSHAPDHTRRLLEDCGLAVVVAEIDDPSSRGHLAILAIRSAP